MDSTPANDIVYLEPKFAWFKGFTTEKNVSTNYIAVETSEIRKVLFAHWPNDDKRFVFTCSQYQSPFAIYDNYSIWNPNDPEYKKIDSTKRILFKTNKEVFF